MRAGRWAAFFPLCLVGVLAHAGPDWSDRNYSFYLSDEPVHEVIRELATREGIPVSVDGSLSETVSARFEQMTAGDVFETLTTAYNLQWHFDGHVLHVEPVEGAVTRTIELNAVPVSTFRNKLARMGVLDERFLWRGDESSGVVVVSGPERYVARVEELAGIIDHRSGDYDSVYRWVDGNGQTHISSTPPAESVQADVVQLPRNGGGRASGGMLQGGVSGSNASQVNADGVWGGSDSR